MIHLYFVIRSHALHFYKTILSQKLDLALEDQIDLTCCNVITRNTNLIVVNVFFIFIGIFYLYVFYWYFFIFTGIF